MAVENKHIINLQGREYVTYEGLLDQAHKRGLCGIRTTLIQVPAADNENVCIVRAEVDFKAEDGTIRTFSGIGDASPRNVSRGILPHLIRMSETRAKARAMRDGTNIGMTAFEETDEASLPQEAGAPAAPRNLAPANPQGLVTDDEMGQLWAALRAAYGERADTVWREHITKSYRKSSTKELTSAEAHAATAFYLEQAQQAKGA
jgi:hypothetical protein